MGIPTVAVVRKGFEEVNHNAFAGFGFSAENAQAVFDYDVLLPGVPLTPVREGIDKFIDGLTKWQPKIKKKTLVTPPKLTIEGKDYNEAVAKMDALFLKNMWGDGLPLRPATEERVKSILKGTDLPPDTAVGRILPTGRIATVETLAATLAMTGGRPEYLPVLIAAVQAIVNPDLAHELMQATTDSVYPAVIVNGPIAKQIRLNSGYSCIGPNPMWPAGASIGRAIQLLLLEVGGAVPGSGSMAIHGAPARYAGVVFAEDEDNIPPGWKPLNVEHFGYPEGSNTVAVLPVASNVDLHYTKIENPGEELAKMYLYSDFLRVPNWNALTGPWAAASPGIVVLPVNQAKALAKAGWTKEKMQVFWWENSMIPLSEIERGLGRTWKEEIALGRHPWLDNALVGDKLPITKKPEQFMIMVAGGVQSAHGYWMQVGCCPQKATSAEIKLPAKAKWDELIKQAEADLGPIPAK